MKNEILIVSIEQYRVAEQEIERNISFWDVIISSLDLINIKAKSFLNYRRTYSNYLTIIIRHITGEFPAEGILRNGKHIKLINAFEAYSITKLQNYPEISYDVENDEVILLLALHGDNKRIRLVFKGGVSNGEVVECFLRGAYDNLPVIGRTVIDIGCNIGDSSIYFALRGADKVIGLEPFLKNYEAAIRNIELNNLSSKITILLAGCAARIGYTVIEREHESDVSSSLSESMTEQSSTGIRVPLLSFQDLLNQIDSPTREVILKMDCEGCEYETVLSTPRDILQKFSHIQIEYHHGYKNIKDKLEKDGFIVSVTRPTKNGRLYIGYIYAKRN